MIPKTLEHSLSTSSIWKRAKALYTI